MGETENEFSNGSTAMQTKSKAPVKRRRGRSAGPVSPMKDSLHGSKRKFGFSDIYSLIEENNDKPWLTERKYCDLCECTGNESIRDATIMRGKLGLLDDQMNNQDESDLRKITPSSASIQTCGSTVESSHNSKEYTIRHLCSKCLDEAGSFLTGMRILVFLSSDDCYYIGQVTSYDDKSNEHCVWYQDGEWEYVKLSSEQFFFLEPFKLIAHSKE